MIGAGRLINGAALFLLPLATPLTALVWLALAQIIGGVAGAVANVNQWSLRQAVTPDDLHARVSASHRFLVYGVYPAGALLGGLLGSAIGLRPALHCFALGATLAPLWLLKTPVWRLAAVPAPAGPPPDNPGGNDEPAGRPGVGLIPACQPRGCDRGAGRN